MTHPCSRCEDCVGPTHELSPGRIAFRQWLRFTTRGGYQLHICGKTQISVMYCLVFDGLSIALWNKSAKIPHFGQIYSYLLVTTHLYKPQSHPLMVRSLRSSEAGPVASWRVVAKSPLYFCFCFVVWLVVLGHLSHWLWLNFWCTTWDFNTQSSVLGFLSETTPPSIGYCLHLHCINIFISPAAKFALCLPLYSNYNT